MLFDNIINEIVIFLMLFLDCSLKLKTHRNAWEYFRAGKNAGIMLAYDPSSPKDCGSNLSRELCD